MPSSLQRQAILGSAWKRRALVQLRQLQAGTGLEAGSSKSAAGAASTAAWAQVREDLLRAHGAYALCEGDPAQADWNPYPCMNRLQLGWLLGESIDDAMLEHCLASARKRFARSFDFFD
ncbi:hypothetical protein RZS08_18755, partial [Arthrospira platensis SPKY1]|nr:hypothetical protein [Arthrospira platensis SPKY1]